MSVSGYLIGSQAAGDRTAPAGRRAGSVVPVLLRHRTRTSGYDRYRRDFAKLVWQLASPKWVFDDATFDASAVALDNADHAEIVVHNYRWRLGLADGDPRYAEAEARLAQAPTISVPTITLEGDADGAPHPDASAYAEKFTGPYEHRVITGGVGHNLAQEAPGAFTQAIIDVDGMR